MMGMAVDYRILSTSTQSSLTFISVTLIDVIVSYVCIFIWKGEWKKKVEDKGKKIVTVSVYQNCCCLPEWTSLPVSVEWSSDQRVYLLTTL